jgi:hypothetical protein
LIVRHHWENIGGRMYLHCVFLVIEKQIVHVFSSAMRSSTIGDGLAVIITRRSAGGSEAASWK